jgi:hypothetical protein
MGQAVGAKRSEVVQAGVFQTAGRGPPEQQHAVDTTSTTGSLVKIFKIQSAGRDSSEGMTAMDGHKQAGIQLLKRLVAACCSDSQGVSSNPGHQLRSHIASAQCRCGKPWAQGDTSRIPSGAAEILAQLGANCIRTVIQHRLIRIAPASERAAVVPCSGALTSAQPLLSRYQSA